MDNPIDAQNLEETAKKFDEKMKDLQNQADKAYKELKDAQERLKGGFIIELETNAKKASNIGIFEALGFGYNFMEEYVKMIDEVTASDIIRVANKYFNNIYVESIIK